MDGTIADITHRLHYVQPTEEELNTKTDNFLKKDWKGFFSEMDKDPVRKDVQSMLIDYYNKGKTIIFISARPEDYKDVTLKWLTDNLLSFAYTVIMRPKNDKRPDTEVKSDMLDMYFPDKSVIHAILDDRPSIINLWKERGLNVIDVGNVIEF